MIVSDGRLGAVAGFGTGRPRGMNGSRHMGGLRINGYGASMSFGDESTFIGPTYDPSQLEGGDQSNTGGGGGGGGGGSGPNIDIGSIGTGIGSVLTGIANLFVAGQQRPGTTPYGPGTNQTGNRPAQQPQGGISPALIGAGILGLGVLLVVMKKKT